MNRELPKVMIMVITIEGNINRIGKIFPHLAFLVTPHGFVIDGDCLSVNFDMANYDMNFNCTWKYMCSSKVGLFFSTSHTWEILSFSFQTQMEVCKQL